jgi:hypothetical protein
MTWPHPRLIRGSSKSLVSTRHGAVISLDSTRFAEANTLVRRRKDD